jgi:hypothetical protein
LSIAGLALLACFNAACSTMATVTRRNAPALDARIIGGDSENVYVESGNGRIETIPRSDIQDIDHPGNVAALIGGIISAYGLVNIVVGSPNCETQGAAYCTGVFLPMAVGLPIMSWGGYTHTQSLLALEKSPADRRGGSLFVLPTQQFAGQAETPGVSLGGTF